MYFDRLDKGYQGVNIQKDIEIELNKKMGQTISEVRKEIKSGECFYCGKPTTSYCNSHSIPRFCLENIGTDGKVAGINAILKMPTMGVTVGKEELGLNESGTFHLICRECDNTIFQDYENPENYNAGLEPTPRMVAQIALKNYLKRINKRQIEIALSKKTLTLANEAGIIAYAVQQELRERIKVSEIDLEAYISEYNQVKKFLEKGKGDGFYLFYYKLLDYVAPITIQAPIAVSVDLDGAIVNDIFNKDPKYVISDLHLCVFPLRETTAVLLFVKGNDKRYRKFRKQFNKLDDESKLGVINYLIFLYCEDYYMAQNIQELIDVKILNEIANLTPVIWDTKPINDTNVLLDKFDLNKWNSIPNLLSDKYKLR